MEEIHRYTQEPAAAAPSVKLAKSDSWVPLQVGDSIQYWSKSQERCFSTKVTAVDENNSITMQCKPGVWIKVDQQRAKITRTKGFAAKVSALSHNSQRQVRILQDLLASGQEAEFARIAELNFDSFDSDADDSLHFDDFVKLCNAIHQTLNLEPAPEALLYEQFATLDAAHDGRLPRSEFVDIFRRILRCHLASFKVLDCYDVVKSNTQGRFEDKYDIGKRLGAGSCGVAYQAFEKASNATVVVKFNNNPNDRGDYDKVKNLSHPHIIRVIEVFTVPRIAIVSEFCAGGDLFNYISECHRKKFPLTYQFVAHVMSSAMDGVHYLHETANICHNDIKSDNIFVDRKPTAEHFATKTFPRCVIADFGLAKAFGLEAKGDPRYKPPEFYTMNDSRATKSGDIWALGVTQFEMLSGGNLIFTNHRNLSQWESFVNYKNHTLFNKFAEGIKSGRDPDWEEIAGSTRAVDLTQHMLARNANERIPLNEALRHPFFNMLNEDIEVFESQVSSSLARRSQMTKLKMTLLNMVALKLHGEVIERFASLWSQFDLDKSGVLDESEFLQIALTADPSMTEDHARELFQMADLDGNRCLNFLEFTALMANADNLTHEQLQDSFKRLFCRVCIQNNGRVTLEDFTSKFPSEMADHVEELFFAIDTNNDGFIDEGEFVDYIDSM